VVGGKYNQDSTDSKINFWDKRYYIPYLLGRFKDLFTGINIILVGFASMQILFPVFAELKIKLTDECVNSFKLATRLTGTFYLLVALLGIYMFGTSVHDVESKESIESILDNIASECQKPNSWCWLSILIRILFLVIFIIHMPFVFYTGKEALLIIVDEFDRKTYSDGLEEKLRWIKEKEDKLFRLSCKGGSNDELVPENWSD